MNNDLSSPWTCWNFDENFHTKTNKNNNKIRFLLCFSPTKASGGMFSNVTGKVSGWLPTNLPSVSMPSVSMPHVSMPQVSMPSIPGLRKSAPGEEAAVAENSAEQPTETQPIDPKDDDDRSRWVLLKTFYYLYWKLKLWKILLFDGNEDDDKKYKIFL